MIIPRAKIKRPKWNLTTQFTAALAIAVLSSIAVFLLVRKDIWTELEIIASVLSLFAFIYFFLLFYHGVRFDRNEIYSIKWPSFKFDKSWLDSVDAVDTGGFFTSAAAEAGPLGLLIGLLLDIVFSIFLAVIIAFLLWFGFNVFITGVMILMLPLYFLFRRSLRIAVARAKTCRGDFSKSMIHAFVAAVVNITWLYLIIYAGHHISFWFKIGR